MYGEQRVYQNWLVQRGKPVINTNENYVVAHPLDLVDWTYWNDPSQHLEKAMKVLLDHTNERFARKMFRISREPYDRPVHVPMKFGSNGLTACGRTDTMGLFNFSMFPHKVTCLDCHTILVKALKNKEN